MGFEWASNRTIIGQLLDNHKTIIEESPKQHHVLIINYLQKPRLLAVFTLRAKAF